MSLRLVTDLTREPVSIEDQKLHLRLDGDDDDAYVATCIKAARLWVEGQTKYITLSQTWDYKIDHGWPYHNGSPRIDLPLDPLKDEASPSTTVVTYVDSNGTTQTLAQSQYTVVPRDSNSYIVPAYNITWPEVRCVPDAINVRFVAGNSSCPEVIKQAVKILASHYYEMRETAAKAPMAVEALISPYRKVMF